MSEPHGGGEDEYREQKRFLGKQNYVYDILIVDTCHMQLSKLTECVSPRVTWTLSDNDLSMQLHHWKQIHTSGGVVEKLVCVGIGAKHEISIPSVQFCCELKLLQEIKASPTLKKGRGHAEDVLYCYESRLKDFLF